MTLLDKLKWRYATKRMNGTKVPLKKLETILEAMRLTPTSLGLQAYKILVVENEKLKNDIFNSACQQAQIKESSHVLILAAYKKVNEEMVDKHIQNIATTRSQSVESLAGYRSMFNAIIAGTSAQNFIWTARQTYIALGFGLIAAAEMEVDATPIEGFNAEALDKLLGLDKKNLSAVTLLALGYRDEENDRLAKAPKVRKTKNEMVEVIG